MLMQLATTSLATLKVKRGAINIYLHKAEAGQGAQALLGVATACCISYLVAAHIFLHFPEFPCAFS